MSITGETSQKLRDDLCFLLKDAIYQNGHTYQVVEFMKTLDKYIEAKIQEYHKV